LNRIESQASSPDFWSDQEAAQKLLQVRSQLEKKIERQEQFESEISDAEVLFEFAEEDVSSIQELSSLLKSLEHELSEAETEMLLAGDHVLAAAALLVLAPVIGRGGPAEPVDGDGLRPPVIAPAEVGGQNRRGGRN
jgi:peptide chain release factor 2